MNKAKGIICITCLTVLAGCSAPYKQNKWYHFVGGGYESESLNDGSHIVTFTGNGYTSNQRALDYALIRSSEICIEEGKKYIELLNTADGYERQHLQPGQYISVPVGKHHIKCHAEQPNNKNMSYNAGKIQANLTRKYDLDLND